jgi:hypothetical protein
MEVTLVLSLQILLSESELVTVISCEGRRWMELAQIVFSGELW